MKTIINTALRTMIIYFNLMLWLVCFAPAQNVGIGDPNDFKKTFYINGRILGEPKYHIEIENGTERKIIDNIYDSRWEDYPDIKTKVIMELWSDTTWGISTRFDIISQRKDTTIIFFPNYKEYWNNFLLCEPNPSQKLEIRGTKSN